MCIEKTKLMLEQYTYKKNWRSKKKYLERKSLQRTVKIKWREKLFLFELLILNRADVCRR